MIRSINTEGERGKVSYDAAEDLGREKGLHILSREEQSRPSVDKHQAHDDSPAIPEPFRHPAVDEEADKFANIGALKRSRRLTLALPRRRSAGSREGGGRGSQLHSGTRSH